MKIWIALCCIMLLAGCEEVNGTDANWRMLQAEKDRVWNGPCADSSVLLATTSGSPSDYTCTNKRHHMRVEIATKASREEVGALVFCECERDAPKPAAQDGGK